MCEFKLSQMKGKRPTVLGVKRQYHYWCGHFAPVGAFYTIQVLKEKYDGLGQFSQNVAIYNSAGKSC